MGSRRPATEEDPGELFVIDAARAVAGTGAVVGIGDDGAVLADGTVVTVDTMVEGVHWDQRLSAADVGYKLVATNVSDLDAMGARPSWAVLALSLPAPLDRDWVSAFFAGFAAARTRWPFVLAGGDTTRATGPRVASLTLAGRAARPCLRAGASPGEDIWVSGELGLAAEGYASPCPRPEARAALQRPPVPAPLGARLAEEGLASAMIDLSDGLARDLARLCRASRVGALVDPAALPTRTSLGEAVAFGEDYQLCFTAPPSRRALIESLSSAAGVAVTAIGTTTPEPEIRLLGHEGWPSPSFDHFEEPGS